MQAILKTVNENGGWSLTAWSKQGKIKDEAQKKDVNRVMGGSAYRAIVQMWKFWS